ncbi:MAG: Bifunctional metallophosphatase/5-nucleotidase [Cyanobacteriota bacterium erpe_2018_sw_39hr_WHONDRS-SW48-000098_B_bin.30]|nr:Bifunctional metallophosphatase/5-nucleotidase [Cyanobacteriota bacterium erpe_2018_sw_39hr_WHONDRS-SW48-000098_B_bin.30]
MTSSSGKGKRLGTTSFLRSLLLPTLLTMTTLLIFGYLPQASADKAAGSGLTLTILHTNDLHSHLEPFAERGKTIGGMARLGHLIRTLRKESPNCLVIDAGDMFQGTPIFTHYRGEAEVALLNLMGYDIYTIGNHEFDEGAINLASQLAKARFDIINCNLDARALPDLDKLIKPYVIRTLEGQRVAFVGAITPDIESLALRRDGVVLKRDSGEPDRDQAWLSPIKQTVAQIKEQGIDKIILVTHCGLDNDRIIAAEIPDVDAIVGGHSHTRLAQPVWVERSGQAPCMIVQTGSYGRNLGDLSLTFDKNGNLVKPESRYKLIPITERISQEPDIQAYVTKLEEPLKSLRETHLSVATADFDNAWRFYKNDSPLGDLIADSFLEAGKSEHVQIAMENRGGIRSRIEKGTITLEKVEEILPFDNHLASATVTGKLLLKNLEHSVGGSLGGRFLDVAGLKFAYDREKPYGERIAFALYQDDKGKWQPVQDSGTYRIAMTDYSFTGGEGYDFKAATDVSMGKEKLNIPLRKFFEAHPQISPTKSHRICAVAGTVTNYVTSDKPHIALDSVSNLAGKKLALYTSNNLGVTTDAGGAVLPLDAPVALLRDCPVAQFGARVKDLLEQAKSKSKEPNKPKIQKWLVVVVSGRTFGKDNSAQSNDSVERRTYYCGAPVTTGDMERLVGIEPVNTKSPAKSAK